MVIMTYQTAVEREDTELRLLHLLLLDTIISHPTFQKQIASAALKKSQLLRLIIMPNLIWKAGRVASSIRKVALVCLYKVLHEDAMMRTRFPAMVRENVKLEEIFDFIPILQTILQDYDGTSRHLVILSLAFIFARLAEQGENLLPLISFPPEANAPEGRFSIAKFICDLIKRFDDASTDVRKATFQCLEKVFLMPGVYMHLQGKVFDEVVEQLFVHLGDDEDATMQDVILQAIVQVARLSPPETIQLMVTKAKRRMNQPNLDRFLEQFALKEKQQKQEAK